jgi:monofunctional biosynthetic peptidoglycan transglycosylase
LRFFAIGSAVSALVDDLSRVPPEAPPFATLIRARAARGWRRQDQDDTLGDDEHGALDGLLGWSAGFRSVGGFLSGLREVQDRLSALRDPPAPIELITVHAAKGREWETVVVLGFAGFAAYEYTTLPDVGALAKHNPTQVALWEQRAEEAKAAGKRPRRHQVWVGLEDVAPHAVEAVLLSEDAGFYGHDGIDLGEVKAALEEAWEQGELGRGASTITQQLAKNLFLSQDRSLLRKAKEAILARRLEESLSKKRILALYLNVVEWGDGVYGIEAAAVEHFRVGAKGLSTAEGAILAAMLPNPRKWTPERGSKVLRTRALRIVDRLEQTGRIKPEAANAARAEVEAILSSAARASR